MRQLLFLFLWTSIGLSTTNAQQTYQEEFAQKWKNAIDYTIEIAELLPESDYDFRPAEGMRTFREQLMHMMSNYVWLSSSYLSEQQFSQDLKAREYTKKEILELLRTSADFAAQRARDLTSKQLEDEVDFFAGPMSKRQILTLMNDHLTHHRGQIIVYLRLKGIKPPRYRGW